MAAKGFSLGITEEDVNKVGGSSFIGTSGVYDVTVLAVTVDENENGAISLGFYVDLGNDNTQMLYGALPLSTFDNNTKLDGNRKTFGAFCMLSGVPVDMKFNPVEAELPIGKEGAMKEVFILDDFAEIKVKAWVKLEHYRKSDNTIGEKKHIMRFYRAEDNADASELKNPETIGTRFAKDSEHHTSTKYNGCTEEEVKAAIDARKGGTSGTTSGAKSEEKKSRFAK